MKMITTGDIKISVLVDQAATACEALRAVHQAFGLEQAAAGGRSAGGAGTTPVPATGRPTPASPMSRRDLALLTQRLASMEDIVVSDVLLDTDQGRITVFNLPDRPGDCSRIFQAVAAGGIVVDMIVQNLTEPGRTELSFSVPQSDLERTLEADAKTWSRAIDPDARVAGEPHIATAVRARRRHAHAHRRGPRACSAPWRQRGINISMINTSEVRVSVVVDRPHGEEALACLKAAFNVT